MLLFDGVRPLYPNFFEEIDEDLTYGLFWLASPLVYVLNIEIR
jgi:hypothetical protein